MEQYNDKNWKLFLSLVVSAAEIFKFEGLTKGGAGVYECASSVYLLLWAAEPSMNSCTSTTFVPL